jgi:hypothetical protein
MQRRVRRQTEEKVSSSWRRLIKGSPALAVMSDRQLANESLVLQGIEIPRTDKPEELDHTGSKKSRPPILAASTKLA